MPEEDSISLNDLKSNFLSISQDIAELKRLEISRLNSESKEKESRDASERARMERELAEYQSRHGFISQHGAKILSVAFAVISAGLAWYGSKIRSEIDAEQQAMRIETAINDNKNNLERFKNEAVGDIHELKMESVKQTLMIDQGFRRVDKLILKAHSKQLSEEDLPEVDPELQDAVKDARRKKEFIDKFGKLDPVL